MNERLDDYAFHFLNNVENPPVQLDAVGRQLRCSREYYWDNRDRSPCYLFQYTLGGSGTLKSDNKIYPLNNGDAFFLQMPDNDVYYFDEDRNQAPWEFVFLMIHGESVKGYYDYIVNRLGKVFALSEYHPAVKSLLDIHEKAKSGLITNAFKADRAVFDFLCLLCDNAENQPDHRSQLVDNAKLYMEKNYSASISLSSVAEALGVSQSHLSREFARFTGEQPVRYLTRVRLEKAVDMLCSTDRNLDEISAACGFNDSNYFTKVFKRYMLTTPSAFRKELEIHGYKNVQI